MDRRSFIRSVAATALVVAAPAIAHSAARMVGISDRPYQAHSFSGPGYYAFGGDGHFGHRVFYATTDDHWGIALSDGPGEEVQVYVSHRSFDATCCGACLTADEADRRAETGRYRRAA